MDRPTSLGGTATSRPSEQFPDGLRSWARPGGLKQPHRSRANFAASHRRTP